MSDESLIHRFLLAMPALTGTYFGDTLIYVCQHDNSGAMGLMINRPTGVSLTELADELQVPKPPELANRPVLEGGPVGKEQGFVLHSGEMTFNQSLEIAPGIVLSSSKDAIEALTTLSGPQHALVVLGYAGWGAGQLEAELQDDAWLVCPPSRELLFDVPFTERTQRAAANIGIDLRMLAPRGGNA